VEQGAEGCDCAGAFQQRLRVVGGAQFAARHLPGGFAGGKIGQRMDSVHEGSKWGGSCTPVHVSGQFALLAPENRLKLHGMDTA
jgi:hypothetical protein